MVTKSIKRLLKSMGTKNLGYFYRVCYKGVDCGPTVGFRVGGDWVYNEDLYDLPEINKFGKTLVDAVRVSSIVEGSDVEVYPRELSGDFTVADFWDAMEGVNDEASFYWRRDNSRWFFIYRKIEGEFEIVGSFAETWGEWSWELVDDAKVSDKVKKEIEQYLTEHGDLDLIGKGLVFSREYKIEEFVNDSTF